MQDQSPDVAVTDLVLTLRLLTRRMRAAGASHGLSWTQMAIMAHLHREGPATTADLARVEGMKPQSMAPILAALEEQGILARTPHPTDGRQVHLALTDKGIALRENSQDAKRTWLSQAIARLDKREQAALFAASDVIKRLVEL